MNTKKNNSNEIENFEKDSVTSESYAYKCPCCSEYGKLLSLRLKECKQKADEVKAVTGEDVYFRTLKSYRLKFDEPYQTQTQSYFVKMIMSLMMIIIFYWMVPLIEFITENASAEILAISEMVKTLVPMSYFMMVISGLMFISNLVGLLSNNQNEEDLKKYQNSAYCDKCEDSFEVTTETPFYLIGECENTNEETEKKTKRKMAKRQNENELVKTA